MPGHVVKQAAFHASSDSLAATSGSLGVSTAMLQIDKNVERELINHRSLLHPNIIRFKEVSPSSFGSA